jgi:superfamily II DNA/RNA helicase
MSNKAELFQKYLKNAGLESLNEMQHTAIKTFEKNDHMQLLSNTGSGKTIAFLFSVMDKILESNRDTKVMIIAPSRELAIQIEKVYKSLGIEAKISACYGGHKREIEENNLIDAPAVIVGTPGRIADHIRRGSIKTESINTLIIDEFDKLLEQNFLGEMTDIIGELTNLKSKVLTSATPIDEMPMIFKFHDWKVIDFLVQTTPETLLLKVLHCEGKDKLEEAFKLICYIGARTSIIFCNHRESVERVSEFLLKSGIANVYYHGAMEQNERESALCKFRNGTVHFLVTTDLASRGLDIPDIKNIIHYHLPHNGETFTHRNGRTARMDASGTAIVMLGPDEKMPDFLEEFHDEIKLPENSVVPEKPKWSTLYIAAGRKDKVNKIDVVGFLTNKGHLKKDDIGLIEVKDFMSYVAVKKSMVPELLSLIQNEKIKNKKVKIGLEK